MTEPYYEDELVTLHLGDNTDITGWAECDCMVTDPPYGRKWRQGRHRARDGGYKASSAWSMGIIGDESTEARDRVLEMWGPAKPAVLFGDLMLPPPLAARLVCVYAKPADAGVLGAIGGVRRDCEAIYLCGKDWRAAMGGRSSIFRTAATSQAGIHGIVHRSGGHPHAKALDVMRELIALTPPPLVDRGSFRGVRVHTPGGQAHGPAGRGRGDRRAGRRPRRTPPLRRAPRAHRRTGSRPGAARIRYHHHRIEEKTNGLHS